MSGLLKLAVAVAVAFAVFSILPVSNQRYAEDFFLTVIALAFGFAAAVMLAYTREWSLIGRGLLATMLGDAVVYGRVSPMGRHVPFLAHEWVADLARALLLTGACFLVVGLVIWVREQRNGRATLMVEKVP